MTETAPPRPLPTLGRVVRETSLRSASNGLIGVVFSSTGPVAVILAAGAQGGLTAAELASWIFGVFFLNGILTILASWVYQRPLGFFWTIPGTVLVGNSLTHMPFSQVVGVYFVTGALILVLGATGLVSRVMSALPTPIVMAMVAGVFLQFGVGLVESVSVSAAIAFPMIVVFVLLSYSRRAGTVLPPVLGALLTGVIAVAATGQYSPADETPGLVAVPVFTVPEFAWPAIVELVVPLAITVLVVQNGQGVAVLRMAGHPVPVTPMTLACGLWSLLSACVGAVSSCLTGPTNAILTSSGARERQYTAAIICGLLAMLIGLFAPLFVALMLGMPAAFIAALAGLAMLAALKGSFVSSFTQAHTHGALAAFLVTVAGIDFLGVSAAFWGLVTGVVVSRFMDRATVEK
ncbi:benzoate/H(+) symporter BenE family transporter [Hoyosella sp. YIM 151337]|uniref:benzoate/H(+) symporter BenE family transporter n=1 Tax=Hoyosella sp. YIM 151337 TaxID=2992742 RepID=UPI0035A93937